jgi:DNA-binding Xre family transcriptional regulator
MPKEGKKIEIINLNLLDRFRELPYKQVKKSRKSIIARSGQSESTFDKVLRGKSANIYVFLAMCEEFNCTMNDIFNPAYKFSIPDQPITSSTGN